MNLSISNIAWLPKDRNKIYRFLSKEKIKGIEIAPKLLLHDIKNIFELNKKEICYSDNKARQSVWCFIKYFTNSIF